MKKACVWLQPRIPRVYESMMALAKLKPDINVLKKASKLNCRQFKSKINEITLKTAVKFVRIAVGPRGQRGLELPLTFEAEG